MQTPCFLHSFQKAHRDNTMLAASCVTTELNAVAINFLFFNDLSPEVNVTEIPKIIMKSFYVTIVAV
jgi:hypothetical protein